MYVCLQMRRAQAEVSRLQAGKRRLEEAVRAKEADLQEAEGAAAKARAIATLAGTQAHPEVGGTQKQGGKMKSKATGKGKGKVASLPAYGEAGYWEERYRAQLAKREQYEWYQGYSATQTGKGTGIRDVILKTLPKEVRPLQSRTNVSAIAPCPLPFDKLLGVSESDRLPSLCLCHRAVCWRWVVAARWWARACGRWTGIGT